MKARSPYRPIIGVFLVVVTACSGCHTIGHHQIVGASFPKELAKANLPEYIIEPPDILSIDILQAVPLPPFKVQSLDVLSIRVTGVFPTDPIVGLVTVDPDGTINLGGIYGTVAVVGKTIEEAQAAIDTHIKKRFPSLEKPIAELAVFQTRGVQLVRGQHLVRPDGTVSLGAYGNVNVSGLTLSQAKSAIEAELSKQLQKPEVIVDVLAYNSKVYYIIFDQGGAGQRITRLPITGNETVLDAISQVSGLTPVSDEKRIWLARATDDGQAEEVLPIDWKSVTARGRASTNYQLAPGDRIFVKAYPLITLDTVIARITSPVERLFGFTLLGNGVVRALQNSGGGNGGNSGGGF
jgi:polysaccharide biosynthesis/export protein